MKTIEEINKINFDELERIADDSSITVPQRLESKVEDVLLASGVIEQEQKRRERLSWRKPLPYVVVSGIAAFGLALAVLLQPPRTELQDSFDSPQLAYAEVEKTLVFIASNINKGLEIASEATDNFEEPKRVMDEIFKNE